MRKVFAQQGQSQSVIVWPPFSTVAIVSGIRAQSQYGQEKSRF